MKFNIEKKIPRTNYWCEETETKVSAKKTKQRNKTKSKNSTKENNQEKEYQTQKKITV